MKRTFVFTLLLLVVCGISAQDFVSKGFGFSVNEDEKTVTFTGIRNPEAKKNASLTIPATVVFEGKTYKVTRIERNAVTSNADLKSLTVSAGVAEIEPFAFAGCNNLTSIKLPSSLKSIGEEAFSGTGISEITIPNGIETIGQEAFKNCSKLGTVNLPQDFEYVFKEIFRGFDYIDIKGGKEKVLLTLAEKEEITDLVIEPGCTKIWDDEFAHCKNLVSVTIPNTVKHIGARAFLGCDKLKSIVIPEGVVSIGTSCFSGLTIESVTLPNSLKIIADDLFSGCGQLTDIHISDSVTHIGDNAFTSCQSLKDFILPEKLESIGREAFSFSLSGKLVIPNSVKSIGEGAFRGCEIESLVIGDGVRNIKNHTFEGCSKLTSYTIGKKVRDINYRAFADCKVDTIIIPDNVKKIHLPFGDVGPGMCIIAPTHLQNQLSKQNYLPYTRFRRQ